MPGIGLLLLLSPAQPDVLTAHLGGPVLVLPLRGVRLADQERANGNALARGKCATHVARVGGFLGSDCYRCAS